MEICVFIFNYFVLKLNFQLMLATLVVAMPFYPEEVGSIVVSPEVVDVVAPAEASASELAEGEDKVNERYGPNYGHQAAGKLNETTLIGIL